MSDSQPAATLIVIRDHENGPQVLLVKRHSELSFASDYWVFPGGKVESSDCEAGATIESHARNAAVRETQEETSLTIQPENLVSTNHWTTPPGYNKCFATWFFVTHLLDEQEVIVDGREIVESVWITPNAALEQYHSGQIRMMLPTESSLVELSKFNSCSQVLQGYEGREVEFR